MDYQETFPNNQTVEQSFWGSDESIIAASVVSKPKKHWRFSNGELDNSGIDCQFTICLEYRAAHSWTTLEADQGRNCDSDHPLTSWRSNLPLIQISSRLCPCPYLLSYADWHIIEEESHRALCISHSCLPTPYPPVLEGEQQPLGQSQCLMVRGTI